MNGVMPEVELARTVARDGARTCNGSVRNETLHFWGCQNLWLDGASRSSFVGRL